MPDPESLHAQILQACVDVEDFIRGMSRAQFMADLKTQRAVEMTFVIIAEIADRIRLEEPDLLSSLPSVPWAQIRGMRNRLVHGYIAINLETVWATASIAIPQLRTALGGAQSGS
jgi:uncharacterized protein with HEPN domain